MNYFFGYFGGKTKVAVRLASIIEKAQHQVLLRALGCAGVFCDEKPRQMRGA